MKIYALLFIFLPSLFACNAQNANHSADIPSHELWDELLKAHVRADGMVDYKGFIKEREKLEEYLEVLAAGAPDPAMWSEEQQLAYWINAYNAFTVKLIVDNYPIESIKDLNPAIAIPTVSTVWNKKFFKIGGVEMSLDQIEHDILRKDFQEPRIHFAINCASVSCPPLRPEAFVADKIDRQLDAQAVDFINDASRNLISATNPQISKIFSWFSGDFKKNGTLIEFLNRYSQTRIQPDADIDYLDYDWALNDVR
ncbi:DUF547 domain-containing protein [Fulvivirga sedimenti]|uniref:DUF547 domain-containing protein n=1 Tax=Fulvivirga sedimenti TaxID=2879465 RepID=A0A9X1HK75_9BACT|nr:DUF547 domain-containing protein [Fulvivirga sedimenti]MCA6073648.1 DUF547 domain-containing protein [Fulvivirga sedimenti]